jgi:hypothetical protein
VAKTIPLRRISAGSFLQGFQRELVASGAKHNFRGLYSLADVSICRKFLRIDNAKIISEAAIPLNGKTSLHFTIKTLVSDTYNAPPWLRPARRLGENALIFSAGSRSGKAKRATV